MVYKIPSEKIQDRFNLNDNNGCDVRILGGPLSCAFGMGIIYTNKDSVSIGVGISLDELKKLNIKPYELLDKITEHPSISNYIKDGELIEYSAHLIPEGSIDKFIRLYDNGVLVAGDAAMLVNNIHFEGTNFAMLSGKFAAETAINALNKKDFSKKTLSEYENKLKKSIIYKDLSTHKNTIPFLKKHISTVTKLYPELMCDFFKVFVTADNKPKNKTYREFLFKIIKSGVIFKSIPLALFAMEKCIKR